MSKVHPICSIEDCGKVVHAQGWCAAHYQKWRQHGDPFAVAGPRKKKAKTSCSIEGCASLSKARGYCSMHYHRWSRYGNADVRLCAANGEVLNWVLSVAVPCEAQECLFWPFPINDHGYGKVTRNGLREYAHRIVCEITHGPQPEGDWHASHSCGNGHLGCLNPQHLSWKTRVDNFSDRLLHGTDHRGEKHPQAKLTESDVRQIRKLSSTMSLNAMARLFGVAPATIGGVVSGKTWGWLE